MRAFIDDIASIFRTDPWTESRRLYAAQMGWHFIQRKWTSPDPAEYGRFSIFSGKQTLRQEGFMEIPFRTGGFIRVYDLVRYGDLRKNAVTVLEFRHERVTFPPFTIHPKGTLSKLKEIFVTSDLMLPVTPDFSARYSLNTNDPKDLKEDLNIEFFDLVGDEPGWRYEGAGQLMIAFLSGTVLPPHALEKEIDRFRSMCGTLVPGGS